MILALGSFGLDIDRSFISLNVGGESGGSHLKIQGSHFKSGIFRRDPFSLACCVKSYGKAKPLFGMR